jgi:succinate-semialdehyde dehydrogenase/glutarate-semialdehyde dehydrogenase
MKIKSVNPTTADILNEFDELTKQQINEILEKNQQAYSDWKETSFTQRKILLKKAAGILRNHKDHYAKLITKEMGKPLKQAKAEVEKCTWVLDFYAHHGEQYLTDEKIETDAYQSLIRYKPLGTILAIMPWNFPFWQAFRCAAPALMAGNTMLLKHSSNVPQCSLAIEEVFSTAGFPSDVFTSLLIGSEKASKLISDKRIAAVSLTGSTFAGSNVASKAGAHLKKVVLELGGSDPFIILDDADLKFTIPHAILGRIQNNGQSCIAAKRFIVSHKLYDRFCKSLTNQVNQLTMDDPLLTSTELGPLIQPEAVQQIHRQIQQSISKGATLLTGGKIPKDKPGFFYPPTILANVKKGMAIYDEETFGPVFALIIANSDKETIHIANDTPYGLGASIWSSSSDHAKHIAQHIHTGNLFINEIVKSDPRLPFGGIKKSGYGRELSYHGIREFVNVQTLYINRHKNQKKI